VENLEKELAATIANFEQRMRDEAEQKMIDMKGLENELQEHRQM